MLIMDTVLIVVVSTVGYTDSVDNGYCTVGHTDSVDNGHCTNSSCVVSTGGQCGVNIVF